MNFFWLFFLSENGVAPQGVFNHLGNFGNHLAPPLENPPKPEFLRDGVIENMVDIDFEGGSYNPYRFVPTVHMGQNQARKVFKFYFVSFKSVLSLQMILISIILNKNTIVLSIQ